MTRRTTLSSTRRTTLPTRAPPHATTLAAACLAGTLLATVLAPATGHAATDKLLLTSGVSSIDGAAGGGLTPWAVIGSYASVGQWGATAFVTRVSTADYRLNEAGVALGMPL